MPKQSWEPAAALRAEFERRLRRCSAQAWQCLKETHPDIAGTVRRNDGTSDVEALDEGLILGELHRCDDECRQLAVAIRRIDRGEYGSCATCGEKIAHKRLLAVPATTNCRDCQDRWETENRSMVSRKWPAPPAPMRL